MATIGESIRKHRKAKGLKQKELAELMGVRQCQVSQWERGLFPNILNCISLADLFCCSLDELVGRNFKDRGKEDA